MQSNIILNIFIILLFGFGVISFTVIIQGWFNHMTASGNEDKVDIAKTKMILGAIFLAIIMAIFTVGNYFISKTESVMADNNGSFNQIFTTNVE